jgi:glycosyltransferase involved in cell wall biosynthesis/GT2 family glycosyltransferase
MTRVPRVSIVSLKWDGVAYYRGFLPLQELDHEGKITFLDNRRLYEADVVILQRVFLPTFFDLIADLKRKGIKLIYEIDDDPFNVPPSHPAYQTYQKSEVKQGLFKTLQSVDLIIAATEPLRELVQSRLGKSIPIRVVGNYLDFKSAWNPAVYNGTGASFKSDGTTVIGWAGALGHKADLELLLGVFKELTRLYQDKVTFRFLGYHPDFVSWEVPSEQVELRPWVDVNQYAKTLYALGLDIGLIPLVDNPHNRAKTNLKFLEYSALGIPSIISHVGPYKGIPKDCARLVDNKFSQWVNAIRQWIDHPEQRRAIGDRARKYVKTHYDINNHVDLWSDAILAVKPDLDRKSFLVATTPNASRLQAPVDIIVPIHNAYQEATRAVASILANTDLGLHRLILIDDGSTDQRVKTYLKSIEDQRADRNIFVITHDRPLGFVKSCNEAMRLGENDVLLLNSDTVVPPWWLDKLQACAYSDAEIGTVTPLSNNAAIVTVPGWNPECPETDIEPRVAGINAVLEKKRFPYYELPTGVGFCFYVKREVLAKYGLFDDAFGLGYGEENDFCLRIRADYKSVVDTHTFVYHKESASFQGQTSAEKERNDALLKERHPLHNDLVAMWSNSDPLMEVRAEVYDVLAAQPKVMHVVHSFSSNAGTELFTVRLAKATHERFRNLVLFPQFGFLALIGLDDLKEAIPIPETTAVTYMENEKRIERAFERYLDVFKPEIVHFQHLASLPLSLPALAKQQGARVIFTLHDNFILCPDPFVLDRPSQDHCMDVAQCAESGCFSRKFNLSGSVAVRRRQVITAIVRDHADVVVAPSEYLRHVAESVFGVEPVVVPHGVDRCDVKKIPSDVVRIGFIGNVTRAKGIQLLVNAFNRIKDKNVELHLYGNINQEEMPRVLPEARIFAHGPYAPPQLPEILANIDIGVVPSIAPEGYGYVLSELASAKVPTIVARSGALPERVHPDMVFDLTVRSLADKLTQVIADKDLQQRAAEYAYQEVTYLDREIAAYEELYRQLLGNLVKIRAIRG